MHQKLYLISKTHWADDTRFFWHLTFQTTIGVTIFLPLESATSLCDPHNMTRKPLVGHSKVWNLTRCLFLELTIIVS